MVYTDEPLIRAREVVGGGEEKEVYWDSLF